MPSNQFVVLTQRPLSDNRNEWSDYWKTQAQYWRTEPEIDTERQMYLMKRYLSSDDSKQGIYPFKDVILDRADVEWLLKMHENKYGPLDHFMIGLPARGLDLRGANLRYVDLSRLPLTQVRCGLRSNEWFNSTEEQREAGATHLEGANLSKADLRWAVLRSTHLEGTDLTYAHLEGAHLNNAHLEGDNVRLPPANLQHALLSFETRLDNIILNNKQSGSVRLADVHWNGVNLTVVKWSQVTMLGDEYEARRKMTGSGSKKSNAIQLNEYELAVRANRQLSVELQSQGLNDEATNFTYRAQVLQKRVWRFRIIQHDVKLRQRAQSLSSWLFSWFLFLLAGYGYRLWRSFLSYVLVIIGFTAAYYLLGASFKPPLSFVNALGLSMTSFHGRGFFPGFTQLNNTLTILASIEAFVGLILEATFIATLTQRFFNK
jgi:hypothetical protein